MFEQPNDQRLPTAIQSCAILTTLRKNIAKGISDVQAGRVETVDIASIKAAGKAMSEIQLKSDRGWGSDPD